MIIRSALSLLIPNEFTRRPSVFAPSLILENRSSSTAAKRAPVSRYALAIL